MFWPLWELHWPTVTSPEGKSNGWELERTSHSSVWWDLEPAEFLSVRDKNPQLHSFWIHSELCIHPVPPSPSSVTILQATLPIFNHPSVRLDLPPWRAKLWQRPLVHQLTVVCFQTRDSCCAAGGGLTTSAVTRLLRKGNHQSTNMLVLHLRLGQTNTFHCSNFSHSS